MSATANLQTGITVKQAAELMNVSERTVYMCRKVLRLRPYLEPEIISGRLSLSEAHRMVTGQTKTPVGGKKCGATRQVCLVR